MAKARPPQRTRSTKPPARPGRARKAALPERSMPSIEAWAAWLERNHASSEGVWLRLKKKGAGRGHIPYAALLDEALCWGWIDGQVKSVDERVYLQKWTPRARRSLWSKRNREKALRLIEDGRMRPAGLAEVDRARADGRWEAAYDGPRTSAVPPELASALEASPRAAAMFAGLDSQNRFAILFRIQTAKRAETRARRIAQFIAMLERGETIHGTGRSA